MYQMTELPTLLFDDERLLVVRRDSSLGGETVVVDGLRVHRGFAAQFALQCNIQPVSGEERIQAAEGNRFVEEYWAYVADSEEPTQVDDLVYRPADRSWYIVVDSENWGSYSKLRLGLQDVGALPLPDGDPLAAFDKQLFVSNAEIA